MDSSLIRKKYFAKFFFVNFVYLRKYDDRSRDIFQKIILKNELQWHLCSSEIISVFPRCNFYFGYPNLGNTKS